MTFFQNQAATPSRIDFFIGLTFILMTESGFVPKNFSCIDTPTFEFNYTQVMRLSRNPPFRTLPSISKDYSMTFILPNLQQFEVKLIVVSASEDFIVNCFVKGIESSYYQVLLDPLTYFTSSNTELKKVKFQQLDRLSRQIKGDIAFPVKYSILKRNGIALPCLEDLPPEVVLIIMRKLPLVDLARLGKTNRKFNVLTRDLFKKIGKKMQ